MTEELQKIYHSTSTGVGRWSGNEQQAAYYFERYINFVSQLAPPLETASLLDVGCGTGWSSYLFARRGYHTTGIDLDPTAFEPLATAGLTLLEASALDLPFDDASFDVVSAYQTLEHVPNPRGALLQMLRVCKPNGILFIVGPNFISITNCFKAILNAIRYRVYFRESQMPRHPYGNTVAESLSMLPVTTARILSKTLSREAMFTMRQPDLTPPFHGDNDACYLCNPIDLCKFLSRHGCHIIQNGALGRLPFTSVMAGGTWIAARKVR